MGEVRPIPLLAAPIEVAGSKGADALRIGSVLLGKYRIEQVLGQGGMGVVVAATHLQLEERVAIKFLLPQALKSRDAITRFMREARAAAKIKNEHVARVLDVGSLETGMPYIVMEHLEGEDLFDVLSDVTKLPVPEAVDYVLQACEALAEAHAVGIVHRDLKPANLFRARRIDGSTIIKILDFGISTISAHAPGAAEAMDAMVDVVGSPAYMSPEQINDAPVDGRADVWGIGVILYELLTGRPPFEAADVTHLCKLVQTAPVRQSQEIPPRLFEIITRMLEKQVARRYASIAEVSQALVEFAPGQAHPSLERIARMNEVTPSTPRLPRVERVGHVTDDLLRPQGPHHVGAETVVSIARLSDQRRGRGWLWLLAPVILLGLGGAYALQRRAEAKRAAGPSPAAASAATSVAEAPTTPSSASAPAASAAASSAPAPSATSVAVAGPTPPPRPVRPRSTAAPTPSAKTEPETPKPAPTDNSAFGPRQ